MQRDVQVAALGADRQHDPLDEALARHGTPEAFNTNQSSQFTGFAFTGHLQAAGERISMDDRSRCLVNIFIERLWRSLKYEAIYLHELADSIEAQRRIDKWVSLLQRREASLCAWRENPDQGIPWQSACGDVSKARSGLSIIIYRRGNSDMKNNPRGFWRPDRQLEYTLTQPPDRPKRQVHLRAGANREKLPGSVALTSHADYGRHGYS